MNFANTHYLPHIILGALAIGILMLYLNYKYFNWVKSYWFFEQSWMSRISSLVYILSIFLMLLSLLDLRGPEEKVKASLPDQRTIIVIDSSASMLAEDIRPSRFGKAIQLARHFVKNAAGHQISIVLFSDIQKRLIPFTDDIDLLDSRLAALEKTNAVSGGSNISQAIAEVVNYFDFDGDKKSGTGNILVFTDAEESEGAFDADIGSNINLAVVGIGTAKGANIPLRWEDGSFRGYKNQKGGQPVVTKLDEDYIKKMGKNVKNYKYWIANSYSLPTEDILNFFRGTYNKSNNKGDMRVRPVFSHLILIPAILLYCLAVFLGRFKSFRTVASIIVLVMAFGATGVQAQEDEQPKKQKELPASLKRDMEKMKSGKADRKEILKIAENLLKNNDNDHASELYKEYSRPDDDKEVEFNRATALLKTQKLDEAMPLIQNIMKNSRNEELKDKLRHNILLSMNDGGKGKSDKKDDKDKDGKEGDKDKKDNKDDKGKEGKDGKDNKDNKDKKDQKDNKDKKDGKEGKDKDSKDSSGKDQQQKKGEGKDDKDKDKKDKPQKDPKDLEKPERPDTGPKSLEEKEKDIEQKRKLVKTPAMIKQILNDDRELQKKMMDTSTEERASRNKRDW
ncbi:MAG: VWA domain-containing protein [Rhizobacter sp.]|nr:VWA domain-containing protein [Bacteriovorax sp.]